MTGLRELQLNGEPLHLRPGLRLPPALTQLHLGSEIERELRGLPQQVGRRAAGCLADWLRGWLLRGPPGWRAAGAA